jgi:hypothetical protein
MMRHRAAAGESPHRPADNTSYDDATATAAATTVHFHDRAPMMGY